MENRQLLENVTFYNTLTKEANEKLIEAFRDIRKHVKYLQNLHERYYLSSLIKASTKEEVNKIYEKLEDFSEVPALFKFYKSIKLATLSKKTMTNFPYSKAKTIEFISTVYRFIVLNRRVPLVNLNIQESSSPSSDFIFYFNLTIEDTLIFSSVYYKLKNLFYSSEMDEIYYKAFEDFFILKKGVKIRSYTYTENYGSALISLSLKLDSDLKKELNSKLEAKTNVK